MGKFGVRDDKEEALNKRMRELGIREEDLVESYSSAKGPGGQNVNARRAAVRLKHLSTGIVVRAQRERTQGPNRYLARRLLAEKIEEMALGEKSPGKKRIEKTKKQKKRRLRRTKKKLEPPPSQPSEPKE